MTTINLYQNQEERNRISGQNPNSGLFLSLGILLVTALAFIGLKLYTPVLQKNSEAMTIEIEEKKKDTAKLEKLTSIMDVQSRLVQIKKNLQITDDELGSDGETVISEGKMIRKEMNELLDELGKDLNKGIVVVNYEYDGSSIDVDFEANTFGEAARQVANFKNSEYFKDINLNSIARKEKVVAGSVSLKY